MRGEVDSSCVPCNNLAIHTSCLHLKRQDSKAQGNSQRETKMIYFDIIFKNLYLEVYDSYEVNVSVSL